MYHFFYDFGGLIMYLNWLIATCWSFTKKPGQFVILLVVWSIITKLHKVFIGRVKRFWESLTLSVNNNGIYQVIMVEHHRCGLYIHQYNYI